LGVAHVDVELTGTGDPFHVMAVSAAPALNAPVAGFGGTSPNGLCARCRDAEAASPNPNQVRMRFIGDFSIVLNDFVSGPDI
jgi:hypothetical protein